MNFYQNEKEIICTRKCGLDEEGKPRCMVTHIYGDVEKPHTRLVFTCDKNVWKFRKKGEKA